MLGVLAWKVNRWWVYLLPGLGAGLAMNVKYNGFLSIILVLGYYAFCIAWDFGIIPLVKKEKRMDLPANLGKRALHLIPGTIGAIAIFALMYLHWYLNVDEFMGYEKLMEHHKGYAVSANRAFGDMKSNPGFFLIYFWMWAPAILILVPVGLLFGLWRWRKEHVILYAWAGGMYAGLFFYTKYTRLAVPILPALCLLGGIFFSRATGLVLKTRKPVKEQTVWIVHGGILAVFVIFSFVLVYPILALDTNGYRKTWSRIEEKYPVKNNLVIFDMLKNFNFYIQGRPNTGYLQPSPQLAQVLKMGLPKVFVHDMHLYWNSKRTDFLNSNKDLMELAARIDNRRYSQIWLEPFNADKFNKMKEKPSDFEKEFTIFIYESSKPFRIPKSWGVQ
jgi:hypothetical protein